MKNHEWNPTDDSHDNAHLAIQGTEKPLRTHKGTFRPVSGPPIRLSSLAATDEEKRELCKAVLEYRWAAPIDCKRFLGWIVTSMIGGALKWRPHVWIVGPTESGKSYLLKNIAEPILDSACFKAADTSVAALVRSVRSDSLPVILDEFEPHKQWSSQIIDLIRFADGDDAARMRAVETSGDRIFNLRFSALLSSRKVLDLNKSDETRFVMIGLSPHRVKDWLAVERGITAAMQNADKYRTAIVQDTAILIEETDKLADELIDGGLETRKAYVTAALSVAWQWWSGSSEVLET